jgi:hypothetical protein
MEYIYILTNYITKQTTKLYNSANPAQTAKNLHNRTKPYPATKHIPLSSAEA